MAGALRKDPAIENWAAMRSGTQKYFRINRSSGLFLFLVVGLLPAGLGYLSYQTHGQIQLAGLRKTESFKREWPKPAPKETSILGSVKEELKQFVTPQPSAQPSSSTATSSASNGTNEADKSTSSSIKEGFKEFVSTQPSSETSLPATETQDSIEPSDNVDKASTLTEVEKFVATQPSSETSIPVQDQLSEAVEESTSGSKSE